MRRAAMALVCAGLSLAACKLAAETPDAKRHRTISVTAVALAAKPRDIGSIFIELNVEDANAVVATRKASMTMAGIIKTLKDGGADGREMSTEEPDTYSRRRCRVGTDGQRTCTDLKTSEQRLQAYVRPTERTESLALAAAAAGAGTLNWRAEAGYSNPPEWYEEARQRALGLAKTKAQDYAAAMGVTLGRIVSVSSTQELLPRTRFVYSYGGVPDQPDVGQGQQLRPDSQAAGATVFVVYAIE